MHDINVPEGSASDRAYLVDYAEDLWNGLPPETQQHCKDYWIKLATALPNVRFVVLKLLPDELFPTGAHEQPYVGWRHEIPRESDTKYTVHGHVRIELRVNDLPPPLRMEIEARLRATYPKGTTWSIMLCSQEIAFGKL